MFPQVFRMDVARWLVAGEIGDPNDVTWGRTLVLLYRHLGLRAVLALRIGTWLRAHRVPLSIGLFHRLIQRRYGLDILVGNSFGGGLYIAHPFGTVLAPVEMGENCTVIASVTVGMRNDHAFPVIGDRVFLGTGARVLGGITVNDDARVGANAVVIDDVPANISVVGIPAKPLPQRSEIL